MQKSVEMGFKKSRGEANGNQNLGYIDDEVKFPSVNGSKDGVEGETNKDEKEPEEKDKSSFFALVSFVD